MESSAFRDLNELRYNLIIYNYIYIYYIYNYIYILYIFYYLFYHVQEIIINNVTRNNRYSRVVLKMHATYPSAHRRCNVPSRPRCFSVPLLRYPGKIIRKRRRTSVNRQTNKEAAAARRLIESKAGLAARNRALSPGNTI